MKKRNKRYFEVKKEELLKKSSKIQNGSLDGEYIRKEERDEQLYSKELIRHKCKVFYLMMILMYNLKNLMIIQIFQMYNLKKGTS